ncbi:MAG: hypothetical protein GY820_15770 [Gammaproteobacteria bacterium]|nr:hypothetical protein [Gammaproteobacteria bacterium]
MNLSYVVNAWEVLLKSVHTGGSYSFENTLGTEGAPTCRKKLNSTVSAQVRALFERSQFYNSVPTTALFPTLTDCGAPILRSAVLSVQNRLLTNRLGHNWQDATKSSKGTVS